MIYNTNLVQIRNKIILYDSRYMCDKHACILVTTSFYNLDLAHCVNKGKGHY